MTNQRKLQASNDVESCVSSKTGKSLAQPRFPYPSLGQHSRISLDDAIAQYGYQVGVIYRIFCQKSNISYVGETREISRGKNLTRIKSHYAALKKGCHPSRKLQEAWDATNGASISDEILEVVAPVHKAGTESTRKIRAREKYWQEQFNATGEHPKKELHYPLKPQELRMLKDTGIINNATLVYLILKLKNPWCDKPVKINPLELAIEWEIPESSVYEAIAKLKEAEVIRINEAEIVITWSINSQQEPPSDNSESFQDSRMDSEIPECILENQNQFQDSRMNSKISENQSSEPLQHKDSSAPHTIQTYTNFKKTLSDRERENFLNFVREKTKDFSPQINDIEGWLAKKNEAEQNRWEVYCDLFHKSQPELVQATQNAKWENHPHHDEWLAEIESTSNPAMFAGSDKEKQAFVSWCWKTNQFSWLKKEGNNDGI